MSGVELDRNGKGTPRRIWRWLLVALALALGVCLCFGAALVGLSDNPPPAQPFARNVQMAPTPTPVPPDRRQVFAYYFYWYDVYSGGHFQEGSGIKTFPPDEPAASWRNVEWHKKELRDMREAGIDSALLVYWGFDNAADSWSYEGLEVIADAWQSLRDEGIDPPGLGMFFDTTIIRGRDLTTPEGRNTSRQYEGFLLADPREQWSVINGRPVIFLFTSTGLKP
jgi:hypothetical protein